MGFWLWYCKFLYKMFDRRIKQADDINNILIKYEQRLNKKEQKEINKLRAKGFEDFIKRWHKQ